MMKSRNISNVVSDMKQRKLNPDKFFISYTVDPKTGVAIILNNRGLAALR